MRGEEDWITSAMRSDCLVERWRPAPGGNGRTAAHAHATWQVTVAVGGHTRLGLAGGESVRPARHLCVLPPGVPHWIADDRSRPAGVRWFALYIPDHLMREAARRAWGRAAWPLFDALVHEDRPDIDPLIALNAALLAGADDASAAERLQATLARLVRRRARPASSCARRDHRLRVLEAIAGQGGEYPGDSIDWMRPFESGPLAAARKVAPKQGLPRDAVDRVAGSRSSRHRAWQALELPPPGLLRRSGQVDLAKRLLATGRTPSHAAVDAGFHDQPHLTRRMRSYAMCTPGRFGASGTDVQDDGRPSHR